MNRNPVPSCNLKEFLISGCCYALFSIIAPPPRTEGQYSVLSTVRSNVGVSATALARVSQAWYHTTLIKSATIESVQWYPHGIERMSRVNDALSSLVSSLIPALQGEDEGTADQRHEEALKLTKGILSE